jgi:SOS response regulatory protein OraA/RecX
MAYMAASKQFRKYRNSDWQEFRNKMLGFLSRRGFNYEICTQTMTRVWDERRVENKTIENEAEI